MTGTAYTHVVVGAGSAGCVLADGLSQDRRNRVLLIEAGPDYTGRDLPAELDDGTTPAIGSHDWGLTVEGPPGRTISVPRGRVVGGTSQINSCIALRPEPTDLAALGGPDAPWWQWDQLLERFRELERDVDFGGASHGDRGPLTIRRWPAGKLTRASAAFTDACRELGHPQIPDHNEPFTTGVGPAPLNLTTDGRRLSARTAFLDAARERSNLDVLATATVTRVVLAGPRLEGVEYRRADGTLHTVPAREVVLAAGAYGTPGILLRSGIGPPDDLAAAGVPVLVDLPGVGVGLSDHSQVPVVFRHAGAVERDQVPCVQSLLRYTSSSAGRRRNDMQLCMINHVELPSYRPDLARAWAVRTASSLTSNLMLPATRGAVRLRPDGGSRIGYAFTTDPADLERHREGVRRVCRMLDLRPFAGFVEHADRPTGAVLDDDRALDSWILRHVQPGHHPVGTARIGAVLRPDLSVHGVDQLYVADAAALPDPVRANTNLTVMAVARTALRLLSDVPRRGAWV